MAGLARQANGMRQLVGTMTHVTTMTVTGG
jgi:hypothetical protein